jgi:hypothetical protein
MKTKTALSLTLSFFLAGVCGNLFAQHAEPKVINQVNSVQATSDDGVAKCKDIIVITGKILDANTKLPIKNTKINFDKFGEEVLQASLDEQGNYLLTLNKKSLGNPVRIVFKIAGYKRYVIKSLDRKATKMSADIFLEPTGSDEKSDAKIKYVMSDSPFNTTVIKMQ